MAMKPDFGPVLIINHFYLAIYEVINEKVL